MKTLAVRAPEASSGVRLDVFLFQHGILPSRTAIQRLIADGNVRINGATTKPSCKLRGGEQVEVDIPDARPAELTLEPWDCPLRILYEDDSLLAVEKPAGMVTHPGAGNRSQTLAHALVHLRPQLTGVGHPLRPGIVHRLDRETSGLLLAAKNDTAYHAITRLFRDRRIEKHYRALAFGKFTSDQGCIEKALGRDPQDRKKISVRARHSRAATTLYRVLKRLEYATLLDVQILTGRTHQIRVHLSSEHHPIVGDSRYGGANWQRIPDPDLRARLKSSGFFGLHAFSLDFAHPFTGQPLHLECPLPPTWSKL